MTTENNLFQERAKDRAETLRRNLVDILKDAIDTSPLNALHELLAEYAEIREQACKLSLTEISQVVDKVAFIKLEAMADDYDVEELDDKINATINQMVGQNHPTLSILTKLMLDENDEEGKYDNTIFAFLFADASYVEEYNTVMKHDVVGKLREALKK